MPLCAGDGGISTLYAIEPTGGMQSLHCFLHGIATGLAGCVVAFASAWALAEAALAAAATAAPAGLAGTAGAEGKEIELGGEFRLPPYGEG